jgi:hypothetical protein
VVVVFFFFVNVKNEEEEEEHERVKDSLTRISKLLVIRFIFSPIKLDQYP